MAIFSKFCKEDFIRKNSCSHVNFARKLVQTISMYISSLLMKSKLPTQVKIYIQQEIIERLVFTLSLGLGSPALNFGICTKSESFTTRKLPPIVSRIWIKSTSAQKRWTWKPIFSLVQSLSWFVANNQ